MSAAGVASTKHDVPVPERIVAAAALLISSQGLRATSVDDIASAAECGRATVYRYFPGGRSELLDVTLGRGVDRIFASCTRITDHAETLAEAVAGTINIAVLELSNDAVDDDDMAEAEDLREQASEEQAGYFRDLVDQLADEDKVSIEHWLKLDIDFRDQFSSWYGSEEFRGKYGNYD